MYAGIAVMFSALASNDPLMIITCQARAVADAVHALMEVSPYTKVWFDIVSTEDPFQFIMSELADLKSTTNFELDVSFLLL